MASVLTNLIESDPHPLYYPGDPDKKCAVEEAASRGPDFACIAVKLFEHGCKKEAYYTTKKPETIAFKSVATLVRRNYMDDHTVSACMACKC